MSLTEDMGTLRYLQSFQRYVVSIRLFSRTWRKERLLMHQTRGPDMAESKESFFMESSCAGWQIVQSNYTSDRALSERLIPTLHE